MDLTTVFCPNQNCPARDQTGQGNISIHSRKEQRCTCHVCDKTFSATKGTVFYRLRTSAETVVIVVTCSPMDALGKWSWPFSGLTSGRSPLGGHALGARGRPCTSTWSNNHATWGRSKPTADCAREALYGTSAPVDLYRWLGGLYQRHSGDLSRSRAYGDRRTTAAADVA